MKATFGIRFNGLPDYKSSRVFESESPKEARHAACMAAADLVRSIEQDLPDLYARYHGWYWSYVD